jgi:hypothetical protein
LTLPVTLRATEIMDSIGLVDLKVRSRLGPEPEPGHRDSLLEALPEAGGGAGVISLNLLDERPQLLFRTLGIGLSPGPVQLAADEGALVLGQVIEHVPTFMLAAAGNQDSVSEGGLERGADGLAAERSRPS